MSNVPFGIGDNQNSTIAVSFADTVGNPVTETVDPGTLAATSSDPASLAVSISADGGSIVATADGALDNAVVVSATCAISGVAYDGSETFNVGASAPTQMILTPSTPVDNA